MRSKVNDHFKVGHYKSLEREKEDEKNVEESEETVEEKGHTDENKEDTTQLAESPKQESGTSDEKDETRNGLSDLGKCLGRVNEKAWTLFCANTVSCLIMVQVDKAALLKKNSPPGLKLATDLLNISERHFLK